MASRTRMRAIVVVLAMGMLACGDVAGMMGDAMVDAGEALRDAGDATTSDAAAQDRPRERVVACLREVVHQRITRAEDGVVAREERRNFAEVDFPGLSRETLDSALALRCDRVHHGLGDDGRGLACPEGSTCESEPPPDVECETVPIEIDGETVRAPCGYTITESDGTTSSERGERWTYVRFAVRIAE